MEKLFLAAAAAIILLTAGALFRQQRKLRRIMCRLNAMLDSAMNGTFSAQTYDESLSSCLEGKLGSYLSALQTSSCSLTAEKEKIEQLIADISHQTKTPIANILLYAQLLAEQPMSPESSRLLHALSRQTQKLNFLIEGLVKLSRLETGVLVLRPRENAVQLLLDDIQSQFSPKASAKGVAFTVFATEASAIFDPKWTAEALANLVDNALKYTKANGAVTISVISYEMFCRIDVKDTGIGVAPDEQARIFSRFYRSPAVAEREGVGVGLYLARQILSGQGGYIKVASSPGEGSTFSVFLPRGQ